MILCIIDIARAEVKRGGRIFLGMEGFSAKRAIWPGRWFAAFLLALALCGVAPSAAQARVLQCVPYAREISGIEIHGNAGLWWSQAEGRYQRGAEPRSGAVMVFRPSAAMPLGHVAVVGEIVDERHVLLDHANWSGPGRIERRALAQDVSEAGDWSAVRVWWAPDNTLGARENPVFGFIYNEQPDDGDGEAVGHG
jgi:surface antigen